MAEVFPGFDGHEPFTRRAFARRLLVPTSLRHRQGDDAAREKTDADQRAHGTWRVRVEQMPPLGNLVVTPRADMLDDADLANAPDVHIAVNVAHGARPGRGASDSAPKSRCGVRSRDR